MKHFTLNNYINTHVQECYIQRPQKVNVWAGIVENEIISQFRLKKILTVINT